MSVSYVLRRYLIELNTTNSIHPIHPIHPIKLNLWRFLLLWCNFYRFNLFWCKNIKIFVFCARINLKGVDRIAIPVIYCVYTHKKTCITSCLVKVLYRSSPTPLITVRYTNLTLYELVSLPKWCWTFSKFLALHISPMWTSIKHCVISFALFDARWTR